MKTEVTEMTIQRSKWTGVDVKENLPSTLLVTSEVENKGHMCCLGFLAIACGLTAKDIEKHGTLKQELYEAMPDKVVKGLKAQWDPQDVGNTQNKLIRLNDSTIMDLEVKETKIISLFHLLGINLTFED